MISARVGAYFAISFLLLLFGIGFIQSIRLQSDLEKYIEEYNKFKENAEISIIYADSLQSVIEEYTNQVDSLQTDLRDIEKNYNSSSTRIKELERERNDTRSQVTDSIIEITPLEVLQYVEILEEENSELRISVEILDSISENKTQQINILSDALNIQTIRADSLYTVVLNIPDAPKNTEKIFGFNKPNRLTMFLIGAATASTILLSR